MTTRDERGRRRKLEAIPADYFEETRGTTGYEMYRAHMEHAANAIEDLFAAMGEAEREIYEKRRARTVVARPRKECVA